MEEIKKIVLDPSNREKMFENLGVIATKYAQIEFFKLAIKNYQQQLDLASSLKKIGHFLIVMILL